MNQSCIYIKQDLHNINKINSPCKNIATDSKLNNSHLNDGALKNNNSSLQKKQAEIAHSLDKDPIDLIRKACIGK